MTKIVFIILDNNHLPTIDTKYIKDDEEDYIV